MDARITHAAWRMVSIWAWCICLLLPADHAFGDEPGFQAGFARVDITPPAGWRRAGGYTEVISTGVLDPLQSRAMVLTDGGIKLALVANDLTSVPRDLTLKARQLASVRTGIPIEQIVITATHTHGGPEYFGPLRDVLHARALREHGGRDPHEAIDYQAMLIEKWVSVIAEAHAKLAPAALSIATPHQNGVAFNRRYLMRDGSTGWIPGKNNPEVLRPLGPTDPELPFLLARDPGTGRPRGAFTVFAMHTAIYGDAPFSACYPGHLERRLQALLDAPEFCSLFGQGCAGDVNHVDVNSPEPQQGDAYAARVGDQLARTIQAALPTALPVRPGYLAMRSATLAAPVAAISAEEFGAAQRLMDAIDRNKADFLTIVDAWRKMFRRAYWERYEGRLPQEIQAIRLDPDTAVVTLPHEVFVELGIAIKAGSPFKRTVVVSLANDLDFYIPTRRAFEEGHYEPTTCPLEPGCGERLVQAALNVLHEVKSAPAR
jgi:hypothetical protein